jgi:hypothetical protein
MAAKQQPPQCWMGGAQGPGTQPNVLDAGVRSDRPNSTPHADARATAELDQPPSAHAGEGER